MSALNVALIQVTDTDFQWMLGEHALRNGLKLPEGGVDDPAVLLIVPAIKAKLHNAGIRASWMAVCDGEVIGLCSYRRPPSNGRVEIGYGIAPVKRGRGYATSLVAAVVEAASLDPLVDTLVAETALRNLASHRVLERNGFTRTGTRIDAEDGEVNVWAKRLREGRSKERS